jgi:urease accessory protein
MPDHLSLAGEAGALVRLLTWLSPAFPTGGFAYSHGLEWAVEAGDVREEGTAQDWIADVLAHGAGWSDAILLRHAHRARNPEALREVAALAAATASGRERRLEMLGQGAAFAAAASVWGGSLLRDFPDEGVPLVVAFAATAATHGIAEEAASAGFLHAFVANLVSAAVRLVPLGQTAGLRVLAALEPRVLSVTDAAREAGLEEIGGCAFRSDIAAMRHETQYTRLFRS